MREGRASGVPEGAIENKRVGGVYAVNKTFDKGLVSGS
jgi:hypothetical protein